ncbi:MAG: IS630 family transposase [Planctomycetota bacterium]|jgi:transposase|nr:IS630 family transposase [Planctomycetota bacterium]
MKNPQGKKGRPVAAPAVTDEQRGELERRVRAAKTSRRDHLRASVILLRADGLGQKEVAERLGCSENCVSKWTARFRRLGLEGLADAPGRGRKPSLPPEKVEAVIMRVSRPAKGLARWSVRTMAEEAGVSKSTVSRLWRANGLKPHLARLFKLSNDARFEERFWDVVGLYMAPPENGIVLCCDGKTQCQALERTQPALPLAAGKTKTFTHDYIRHGVLCLFAALDYATGKVTGKTGAAHTHKEWLAFLRGVEKECPRGLTLHMVQDNYSTHRHAAVTEWVEKVNRRHEREHGIKRIVPHFTPTSGSWLNMVERFTGDITQQAIRNESFASLPQLASRIRDYIDRHNGEAKRYVWKADGRKILERVRRAREALGNVK